MRINLGAELMLTEPTSSSTGIGNQLVLAIDVDSNSATGATATATRGAEIEIRLGQKSLREFSATGSSRQVTLNDRDVLGLPTHSGTDFELRIPYARFQGYLGGAAMASASSVRFWLVDESSADRLPASGSVSVTLQRSVAEVVAPANFARPTRTSFRLLTHNILRDGLIDRPDAFEAIWQATQPDILCLQESYDMPAADAAAFASAALGGTWFARGVQDCIVVSRWPIVESAALDGNIVVRIDLPNDVTPRDLVVFNAHTPCCRNDTGRDSEHDRISSTWRDMLNGFGPIGSAPGDAMITTGDFNMVGFVRQLETLRDGNIINNATFGADFQPGRAEGSLRTIDYPVTGVPAAFSWYSPTSTFLHGRLDWTLYTGDELELLNAFAVHTPGMSSTQLQALGLSSNTSTTAADHLTLIADFRLRTQAGGSWVIR